MAVGERYGEGRMRLMPVGLLDLNDGDLPLVYPVDKGSGATTSLVEADGVVAVDPDTEYLDRDERVTVQLFSPDVRPPTLLGVGEDDPALNRLLDRPARRSPVPPGRLPWGSADSATACPTWRSSRARQTATSTPSISAAGLASGG